MISFLPGCSLTVDDDQAIIEDSMIRFITTTSNLFQKKEPKSPKLQIMDIKMMYDVLGTILHPTS
jgi:hypothetical protein